MTKCGGRIVTRTWFASHGAPRTCSPSGVTLVSWDQEFFDPTILPGQKPLVTLRDAAQYITKLPKAEHDAEEWQAAMQALLLIVEYDGSTIKISKGSGSDGSYDCRTDRVPSY